MNLPAARSRLLSLSAGPGGLICAFRFQPDTAPARLTWHEVQNAPPTASGAFHWIHAKTADSRIQDWLEYGADVPEEARAFLAGRDTRPCLHMSEDGVHGLLVDLKMDAEAEDAEKGILHFFMNDGLLITVRTRALQSTDRLRRRVEDGRGYGCTTSLFGDLLECLAEGYAARVEMLTDEVDDIEASVLSDRRERDRGALSAVRRQLADLRRQIHPERHMLGRLPAMRHAWAEPEALDHLAQGVDTLSHLAAAIDALYERAKLLQEEIAAQMSEEMNRNLLVLSVLTAMLMPATLLSGIFGMNVADLPGLQTPGAFWWVLGAMAALGVGTLVFLKRLRLW